MTRARNAARTPPPRNLFARPMPIRFGRQLPLFERATPKFF